MKKHIPIGLIATVGMAPAETSIGPGPFPVFNPA